MKCGVTHVTKIRLIPIEALQRKVEPCGQACKESYLDRRLPQPLTFICSDPLKQTTQANLIHNKLTLGNKVTFSMPVVVACAGWVTMTPCGVRLQTGPGRPGLSPPGICPSPPGILYISCIYLYIFCI